MRTHSRPGRLAPAFDIVLAFVLRPLTTTVSQDLHGITQDGSRPADQSVPPPGNNAFRGGGWFSGGWIRDGCGANGGLDRWQCKNAPGADQDLTLR